MSRFSPRRILLAAACATAAVAASVVPGTARADTWIACDVPSVAGPVWAADGRVYYRGTGNCNGTFRMRMILKVNTVVDTTNSSPNLAAGVHGLGIFSSRGCSSGALYQALVVVSVPTSAGWQDITYASSGAPHHVC